MNNHDALEKLRLIRAQMADWIRTCRSGGGYCDDLSLDNIIKAASSMDDVIEMLDTDQKNVGHAESGT